MERLVVGDPLEPHTDIGPLISRVAAAEVLSAIDDGVAAGGRILHGGAEIPVVPGGAYLLPTLVDGPAVHSRLLTEEVFGPVTAIRTFETLDEALWTANRPGSGMALSIWTKSIGSAFEAARRAKAGIVWVNCFEADNLTVPVGGVKRSGYGRSKGQAVFDKYSDLKTTWIHFATPNQEST
jgi:gamma-glutamyl-gamma-aminobutyraldehyde dehydrogenase